MRIDRLTLENFRGFKRWEQAFVPGFNVLIGDNGSGKTTILDALAIALDPAVYKEARSPSRNIQEDDLPYLTRETPFETVLTATGEYRGNTLSWTRRRTPGKLPRATTRETKLLRDSAEDTWQRIRLGDHVTAPVVAYYMTERRWYGKPEDLGNLASPGSRLLGYTAALNANANDAFLFRWFKTRVLAAIQRFRIGKGGTAEIINHPEDEVLYGVIQSAIAGCMDGPRKWLDFLVDENTVVAKQGNDGFEWNDWVPFRMLSEGQRNVAALVMDIAYRCITLNPHLRENALIETPGVVLIDEIDLHLHPNWQRRVVDDLRRTFPKVQFIVTTHSPIILQSLSPNDAVIQLGGEEAGPTPAEDYVDRPIEDILMDVQNYPDTLLSERRQAMIQAAEEYYAALRQAEGTDGEELERLKRRMEELALPYHDNPAYIAFLNMERQAALGGKN